MEGGQGRSSWTLRHSLGMLSMPCCVSTAEYRLETNQRKKHYRKKEREGEKDSQDKAEGGINEGLAR
ncbi:unnamed protein product [Pleuronectes platessa]|uniref:Uncharacterized protein n=1 Tax=Pleuronectes platessa TaxID=8262 RepID=A0A9N7YPA2_PLEPL|nr:unnamed protein product [Pleuronectes platessa]